MTLMRDYLERDGSVAKNGKPRRDPYKVANETTLGLDDDFWRVKEYAKSCDKHLADLQRAYPEGTPLTEKITPWVPRRQLPTPLMGSDFAMSALLKPGC